MKWVLWLSLMFIAVCAWYVCPALGDTALIVSGTIRTADTTLSSSACGSNYGALDTLSVGASTTDRGEYFSLLRFDLSSVPMRALVVSARLRIYCQAGEGGRLRLAAYRMNTGWNQGRGSGGPASPYETTYDSQLHGSTSWDWAVDRSGEPEAVLVVPPGSKPQWYDFDLTFATADWVRDPLSNHGVLLAQTGEGKANRRVFTSSEGPEAHRPRLEIRYEPLEMESTESSGGEPRLLVGISKAVPLVKAPVTLRAKVVGWKERPLSMSFTAVPVNFWGKSVSLGTVKGVQGESTADTVWTPGRSGLYNIRVEASAGGRVRFRKFMRVPVTVRELHFPYSSSETAGRYVTAIQDELQVPYWKARGVIPLMWFCGTGYVVSYGWNSEQLMRDWDRIWVGDAAKCDGFMIDEFHGEAPDEVCTQALLDYRTLHPERLAYPYLPGVHGGPNGKIAQALAKSADLLLVETYATDSGGYESRLARRWRSVADAGLAGKAVACLIFPSDPREGWITNEPELRRQIRYLRRLAPDMPGVMAYSGTTLSHLVASVDKAIEDYYFNPVLLPKLTDASVQVRNIGETDDPGFKLECLDASGRTVKSFAVKRLQAQSATSISRPAGTEKVRIGQHDRWTTVLDEKEDYGFLPVGSHRPVSLQPMFPTDTQGFSTDPGLMLSRDKDGIVAGAEYSIPASNGRSFTLSFPFSFSLIQQYGWVKIGLGNRKDGEGKSELTISFIKSDDDSDIPGCRARLAYSSPKGVMVRDRMFRDLQVDTAYKLVVHYSADSHVRALCYQGDSLMWDSGDLSVSGLGGLNVDCMRFGVRTAPGGGISVGDGSLILKGSGGSGYNLHARIDEVEVSYPVGQ